MSKMPLRYYFFVFLSLLLPCPAHAVDSFPTRPVRIVVPTGAGGVLTQVMIADIAKWAKVIEAAGIRGE